MNVCWSRRATHVPAADTLSRLISCSWREETLLGRSNQTLEKKSESHCMSRFYLQLEVFLFWIEDIFHETNRQDDNLKWGWFSWQLAGGWKRWVSLVSQNMSTSSSTSTTQNVSEDTPFGVLKPEWTFRLQMKYLMILPIFTQLVCRVWLGLGLLITNYYFTTLWVIVGWEFWFGIEKTHVTLSYRSNRCVAHHEGSHILGNFRE